MLKEVITIKKILFGITSLTLGGAERVLVDISNKLSEKYDITIFLLESTFFVILLIHHICNYIKL